MRTEQSLTGPQVAIVTGAASGIGLATTAKLRLRGMTVIAADIEPLAAADGISPAQLDVSDAAGVDSLVDRVHIEHGRIDVLANIAGIHDGFTSAHHTSDDLWDKVLSVDLTGPFRLVRAVLPIMRAQGSGSIVNVASVAGLSGSISGTAYTVAKHGIVGLTRSVAAMYADDGIRSNAVCPGGVDTALRTRDAPRDEWGFSRLRSLEVRPDRRGTPEEIADAIAFLAGDEADFSNGAVLTVDGGWLA